MNPPDVWLGTQINTRQGMTLAQINSAIWSVAVVRSVSCVGVRLVSRAQSIYGVKRKHGRENERVRFYGLVLDLSLF